MSIFEEFNERRRQKRLERHMKLIKKNAELRAKGINPVKKGWGTMVNTGVGTINRVGKIDLYGEINEQSKNIRQKNITK